MFYISNMFDKSVDKSVEKSVGKSVVDSIVDSNVDSVEFDLFSFCFFVGVSTLSTEDACRFVVFVAPRKSGKCNSL